MLKDRTGTGLDGGRDGDEDGTSAHRRQEQHRRFQKIVIWLWLEHLALGDELDPGTNQRIARVEGESGPIDLFPDRGGKFRRVSDSHYFSFQEQERESRSAVLGSCFSGGVVL